MLDSIDVRCGGGPQTLASSRTRELRTNLSLSDTLVQEFSNGIRFIYWAVTLVKSRTFVDQSDKATALFRCQTINKWENVVSS
jgi:hypothetical protein